MSIENLKKLMVAFTLLSAVILVHNYTTVTFASPALLSGSNSTSSPDNFINAGNEGSGTGGPAVVPQLLSEQRTDSSGLAANNNMTSNTTADSDVFHTKELNVTKHSLREGETSDAITGTIVNVSPVEVNYVNVNAALFDVNNYLIGTVTGSVDFSTLNPGEDTSFKVDIYPDQKEKLDHYMLFVLGTANTN